MVIYKQSDSLSRCDPNLYSNIYDTRKRTDVKQEPVTSQVVIKDTIEISKEKLKEDALSRLRHTSKFVVYQNSFIRIGKYLFLGIVIPPYLALYRIPKWVLVEAIPAVYLMLIEITKKSWGKIHKFTHAKIQKLILVAQLVKKFTQFLLQPFVHLVLKIRKEFDMARERVKKFIQRRITQVKAKVRAMIEAPFLKLKKKINDAQQHIAKQKERLSKSIEEMTFRIKNGIQKIKSSIQNIKDLPESFMSWIKIQIQSFNDRINSIGMQWGSRFHTAREIAENATNWVVGRLSKTLNKVKSYFSPLGDIYHQYVHPVWVKFSHQFQMKVKKVMDFFQKRHRRALAFLLKQQKKVRDRKNSSMEWIQNVLAHPLVKKLPLFFQNWLKGILNSSKVQSVYRISIKFHAFVLRSFLSLSEMSLRMVAKGANLIHLSGEHLNKGLSYAQEKASRLFIFAEKFLVKCLKYILYYTLLFATICLILSVWSIRWLSNYLDSIVFSK